MLILILWLVFFHPHFILMLTYLFFILIVVFIDIYFSISFI